MAPNASILATFVYRDRLAVSAAVGSGWPELMEPNQKLTFKQAVGG